jgi:hypothetical protein
VLRVKSNTLRGGWKAKGNVSSICERFMSFVFWIFCPLRFIVRPHEWRECSHEFLPNHNAIVQEMNVQDTSASSRVDMTMKLNDIEKWNEKRRS